MKSLSLVFIAILFMCACNNQQAKKEVVKVVPKDTVDKKLDEWQKLEKKRYIKSISDTNAVLRAFFAPDTIIHKVALWKPDPDAASNMNVSEDGYCHTNIDTIIKIPAIYGQRREYLIVFTTIKFDKDGNFDGCHACGTNYGCASIMKDTVSGEITVQSFKRDITNAGSFGGKADSICIRRIGRGMYALDIPTGFTGGGTDESQETLYDVPGFESIFTLQDYDGNDSQIDQASFNLNETEKSMTFISNKNGNEHDDIAVLTAHTYFNKKHKKITDKETEIFVWNDANYQYELSKK